MRRNASPMLIATLLLGSTAELFAETAAMPTRCFAHDIRTDRHGVIAPWYTGLNGQCDLRIRIAAETLKRYPWTTGKDGQSLPDYIYSGRWSIADDGTISPNTLNPWGNGDLVQRGTYAIFGLVQYYRYSGDPAAIAHIRLIADHMLDQCQTPADHPWPGFIISVPNAGEPYGPCNPAGMIQLDLAAMAGVAMVQAYELTGVERYFAAARHWADVLAEKRDKSGRPTTQPEADKMPATQEAGQPPWNRYANPEVVFWNDKQTGGILQILRLFDEVIAVGYTGSNNQIVEARDAARAWLRDVLLPQWLASDTWAREYWDWEHTVMSETLAEMVPRYLMRHPEVFPNWQRDARNIMSVYLTRACAAPESHGGVYYGAWIYPEGSQCCQVSLSYAPMQVSPAFAEYGCLIDNAWAREIARRSLLLSTYDVEPTGVVRDGLDGNSHIAATWLQIAHPLPLDYVCDVVGWLPETLGANRENHVVRSTAIVQSVDYAPGRVIYSTFDAPARCVDVLRLAFVPTRISADSSTLAETDITQGNGYKISPLSNGDCIVTLRHDGQRKVRIEGDDPARRFEGNALELTGNWSHHAEMHVTGEKNAACSFEFKGNQVRIIGTARPDGGLADVYLDGEKQLCGIDYWTPDSAGKRGTVWYRNGLTNGSHTLRVVARGAGNPRSSGTQINIDAVDVSATTGEAGWGEGGGPTDTQRWIFGYPERTDHVDTLGHAWRPATEVVIRTGDSTDTVNSWYTQPRRMQVGGTNDPVLYRHGMHGNEFTAYATVAPGRYHVRLKFMETRLLAPTERAMDIFINDKQVVNNMDIAATATGRPARIAYITTNGKRIPAGINQAVDLVFNDIEPQHGVIAVRFAGRNGGEAVASSMEVGPGDGGSAVTPVAAVDPTTAPAPTPP